MSNKISIRALSLWRKFSLLSGLFLAAACAFIIYQHRPFSRRLAAYVTDLSGRTLAQRRNIERAGHALEDVIVESGKSFSLNAQAGPYTAERGFLPERSFMEQHLITSEGGGVCQVASTLYNAARLAGLEIIERFPHSQAVQSVPEGFDATVAYGVADLKFKNPYPFPIKIRSQVLRDQLKVEIWGKESNDEPSE
jgi:vancomycin resistance protein VanW